MGMSTLLAVLAVLQAGLAGAQGSNPFTEARRYTEGSPRTALVQIEETIRTAASADRPALERELGAIVADRDATLDSRGWACRMLRVVGTQRSVPVLAAALGEPRLSLDAVAALRSIAGGEADAALLKALGRASGAPLLAIVDALGSRRVASAVPQLLHLLRSGPAPVAEAAAHALGRIGGRSAFLSLRDAAVPPRAARARALALLMAAESLLAVGDRELASTAFQSLLASGPTVAVRVGALRGLVKADPARGRSAMLTALARGPESLRQAAAALLWQESDASILPVVLRQFAGWPESARVTLLTLADRAWAVPLARSAMRDSSGRVREAASGGLARLADVSSLDLLLAAAAGTGPERAAAELAMVRMASAAVDARLRTVAQGGRAARERAVAVRCLAERGGRSAGPLLVQLGADRSREVRHAALQALARVAGDAEMAGLVRLVVTAAHAVDSDAAAHALGEALRRCARPQEALAIIREAYVSAGPSQRAALLRASAQRDTPQGLALLRDAVQDEQAEVVDTAVQLLVEWPSASVIPDLQRLARSGRTRTHQVLALRGLISLAGQSRAVPRSQAVALLREAMQLAQSAEERRRVLAALMAVPHVSGLAAALDALGDVEVEVEAATAVSMLARVVQVFNSRAAADAVAALRSACKTAEARRIAEAAHLPLVGLVNISPSGTASSPDDLDKDGDAHGDQAAIDGDTATYWDESDGASLYRLRVTFPEERTIRAISILGHTHHDYAPRDFRILCDGQEVGAVSGAEYLDNTLVVPLPATTCRSVELVITGYYGRSPAIREFGIYQHADTTADARRILVFSRTLGYRHANIPLGVAALRRLGEQHGFAVDATEDSAAFSPENLARYQALVLLSVTGDVLDEAQQIALKGYLERGGGVAAIHGAIFGPSAMEEHWSWYGEVCGTAFKNHSGIVPAVVRREDKQHPSTRELQDVWTRTDEWYNFASNPRPHVKVLLTLDEATYPGGEMGADHPIAWCRNVGAGRFWYTAMGHTEESFSEPDFLRHILGGILWAMRP